MKRIDGYLDLEEYFKRKLNLKEVDFGVLSKEKIIKPEPVGSNSMCWLKYQDLNVLFKVYDDEYNIYSELVSEELAKYLGLPNAHYDLAKFGKLRGVITTNFNEPNYDYVNLKEILNYYMTRNNLLSEENEENIYGEFYLRNYEEDYRDELLNNLEDIWNALELYLAEKTNIPKELIPKISERLMDNLTDYFHYQIITGNCDMHAANISVAINEKSNDIKLTPLYDNENMYGLTNGGYLYNGIPRLSVSREIRDSSKNFIGVLEDYLNISTAYFGDKFKSMFNKLERDTMHEILEIVEKRTEKQIPNYIKVKLLANYVYFYGCIKITLENRQKTL